MNNIIIKKLSFFLPLIFLSFQLIAQDWQLVWQDEFTNGIGPDWVFETGNGNNGWGNNEYQYYRRENATVSNGQLIITARNEAFGGRNYTSSRMKTQGRKAFKFGKIEARIALPSSKGTWPAFWMLGSSITSVGWPKCGEIDIMEHVNDAPDIHGTIHWEDHNGQYAYFGRQTNIDVTQFHNYSVEWDQNAIKWFVDGRQYNEVNIANGVNGTSEFGEEFFLLLNLAIAGNFPGFEVDNSRLPAQMRVDYVRVYQKGIAPPPNTSLQIEAENFIAMNGIQTEPCSEGGLNVGYTDPGDWIAYGNVTFPRSGNYTIEYRVASAINGGSFTTDLNAGATVLGQVDVPNTGGWQNWRSITQTVNVQAGTYPLGVYSKQGGWNLNWIRIRGGATKNAGADITNSDNSALSIYPNPATDQILISGMQNNSSFTIYNNLGSIILTLDTTSLNSGQTVKDVTSLLPGLYFLKDDLTSHVIKFIKK